jgi:hypothetical protein
MTHEKKYKIIGIEKKNPNYLTLYEACRELEAIVQSGKLTPATHIDCYGRPVAFWCEWRNTIRPMFGAYDSEKTQIGEEW